MDKININNFHKNFERSSSVLNSKNNPKLFFNNNKKINKNNSFRVSSTIYRTLYNNNYLNKTNRNNNNSLFNDLQSHKDKNHNKSMKVKTQNLKDIDIIKEKKNNELLNKISSYLDQKKQKVNLINRIKEPKHDNLKKLLQESKSDQNILAKTFSTKFIGNEEYNTLSEAFGKGHSKKKNSELKKDDEIDDNLYFRQTKTLLFSKYNINPKMTREEKEMLSSIKKFKNNNVDVIPLINYYDNQYDSFKSLQANKNLFNELTLKQEKEQIKQYLKGELKNEQQRLKVKLMPKIHTIELLKFKKSTKEDNDVDGQKLVVNSITDLLKIPRNELFLYYNAVYLKTISKFLSTPTCRGGAKMLSYLDEKTNINKILLFGGINVVRLDDLWECSVFQTKIEKRYIWKKVEINGDKPIARNGHSMNLYRNNLIIYGGIIEEKGGVKIHEDLLCYNIKEKKFCLEMCMNKFGVTWRSYHISEILGQYMLIYGGGDEKGNILAEPWALDLDRMRWESAKFNTDILPKRKFHCSCQVFPPQKKYHHKFSLFKVYSEPGLFNTTKILVEGIYLFGGIDENFKCSNDVLIIKRGRPLQLFKAITKGKPPTPRCECSMDFFEKLDVVIIYGGRNEYSSLGPFFNDMFFLDVETLNWINIELNYNKNFYPRGEHCSCIVENELIIFGGENDKFYLKSDLLICNLDIGESSKIIKKNRLFKNKNRMKREKFGSMEILQEIYNNLSLNTNSGNDDNESKYNERLSLPFFNKGKLMKLNSYNKIHKDTIMNQKVQTSKNFFLDYQKHKNELQEKFKAIDEINYSSSDNQKMQKIIQNAFLESGSS